MLEIRKCTLSDLNDLYHLEITSFFGNSPESKKTIQDRLSCYLEGCIVAYYDEKFAGGILSELWSHSNNDYSKFKLDHDVKKQYSKDGNELYISTVAVLPEFQGKKIANAMLDYFIHNIYLSNKTIKYCSLIVSNNWPKAIYLYEKHGFKKKSLIANFFEENNEFHDGIIMYHIK